MSVDDGSVQEFPGNCSGAHRLLADDSGGAWVHFNLTVGFPLADQAAARERANAFVLALQARCGDAIFKSVVQSLKQQKSATGQLLALDALPLADSFASEARELPVCVNTPAFELDLTDLLAPLAPAWASTAGAFASYSAQWLRHFVGDVMLEYDSHETAVSVRGPQNSDNWVLYTTLNDELGDGAREYAFTADPAQ